MARKKSRITERKEKLAEAILDGKSIPEASKEAGYANPSGAYQALSCTELQQHLKEARTRLVEAADLKRIDIVDGILEAIELARLATDPGSMIRGYAEIAKMLGFYEPEKKIVELTANQGRIRQKFEIMTDEELLKLVNSDVTVIDAEFSHVN